MVSGGANDVPAGTCPLFLGYFEESHYEGAHYQSIVPVKDGSILRIVRENFGFDVAAHFEFQSNSAMENISLGKSLLCSLYKCIFFY